MSDKQFMKSPEFNKKLKIKYYIASKMPYIYGKHYLAKNVDKDVFWD